MIRIGLAVLALAVVAAFLLGPWVLTLFVAPIAMIVIFALEERGIFLGH